MSKLFLLAVLVFPSILWAQSEQDSIQKLNEVIIETRRISLPFTENSHTISVMDSLEMAVLSGSSVDELLQNINGIDVRRRGIEGMQSDVYIRGGNFEQVLILIDGVKMDDLQSGHHSMNAILSPENIERIEVIKGAASRIYGQNAMNGAINIITKKAQVPFAQAVVKGGSYDTYGAGVGFHKVMENGAVQFHIDRLQSEGYRYNTDFENWNAFFKTEVNAFEILATYGERKFGANGFYASPLFKDQYEETQTHLLAFKRKFDYQNWKFSAQTYWRRNQDQYLLKRNNPDYYRNMHINHKVGAALDTHVKSDWGISGLGVDVNMGYLSSNNLGDRERFSATFYAEQRFQFLENTLDVTPGVAVTYYNDFGTFAYPGIDLGYKINAHFKTYVNAGYTSRIPTFTNLYYNSSTEQGNPDLKPEKAFTAEGGFYYTDAHFLVNAVYFYRNAHDLIDWTKENLADKWKATNFNQVETHGFESLVKYNFTINQLPQNLKIGYTFMKEDVIEQEVAYSRYDINSFKHHVTAHLQTQFLKYLSQNIAYRYVERRNGESYHVFDAGLSVPYQKWHFEVSFNNLFDTDYTETNLVPMPKFNWMTKVSYRF
jgi:vitamin B12 transporter